MEYTSRQKTELGTIVMERSAMLYPEKEKASDMDNKAAVTGFTSGVGGSGTTSAALMLARNYAELCGMKTVFLGLDMLASKACVIKKDTSVRTLFDTFFGSGPVDPGKLFVKDASGVFRMPAEGYRNPLTLLDTEDFVYMIDALRPHFDRIIVDVPISCEQAPGVLSACDSVAVCFGWQDKLYGPSEELYLMLTEECVNVHRFFCFHDEDEPDLYGQLGSEVRRLAKEL